MLSQLLTLYITPVIYLYLDRIDRMLKRRLEPQLEEVDEAPPAGGRGGVVRNFLNVVVRNFEREPRPPFVAACGRLYAGQSGHFRQPVPPKLMEKNDDALRAVCSWWR